MKNELRNLIQGKTTTKNVWCYIQGMYRYRIWYSSFRKNFIKKHIEEQINYRVVVMNPLCYSQGSCIKCGCMTIALQMCDETCKGNCYPPMLSKKEWELYKEGDYLVFRDNTKTNFWIILHGVTKFFTLIVSNV